MSQGSHSPFRFVFWGLLAVIALSFLGLGLAGFVQRFWWHGPRMHGPFFLPFGWSALHLLPILTGALYVGIVGSLVYRDAARRGMDPWLWATVAVFVPALIGVVVYLVVRSSAGRTCPKCGRAVREDYRICPYCGHPQEVRCPRCQAPVAVDWKLCPHCGHSLQSGPDPGVAGPA